MEKGSLIQSREEKSAPKGNFNCLTRPDFLRGSRAGREERRGRREAALEWQQGASCREKDQAGEIPALALEELLQKGLKGYPHRSPGDVCKSYMQPKWR